MTSSVDGLVSGLSTSALISQLMQVEAAPQSRLKTKVTAEQNVLSAYQSINTKLAALETAASSVNSNKTWHTTKATSSDSSVIATAASGASTGSLTFDVTRLARAQVSTAVVPPTGPAIAGTTIDISVGTGAPVSIDVSADNSAQGLVKAINAKGIGVKAALVTTSAGDTVLQLTSTKTGTTNGFSVNGLNTAPTTIIAPADAEITVGDPTDPINPGYTVTSATNSFTNLMSGVTLTVSKLTTDVNMDVTSDANAIAGQMQAMVDAANAAIAEISKQGAYGAKGKAQAPLAGDFTVRQMNSQILSATGNGLVGYGSFKQVGVQLSRDGKLTFDKDAFLAAYAADPAAAQKGASALGDALKKVADKAQDTVTSVTQNHNQTINTLNNQIANWDVRLQTRQTALQKQFGGLEVALGKLKNQSNWLAGQIAGLPSGGGL